MENDEDEELRRKYARKAGECFWSTLYFICSALWGWSILRKDLVLPPYLGGQPDGSYTNFKASIFDTYQEELLEYSFYTFGYHFGNLFRHVFIDKAEGDFYEMLLHHIAAFCLYFCYIFGNMIPIGTVIAYLHDLADIPGNLSKALNSTVLQNSSAVAFVTCMVVWFGTRIISLPTMIWHIFTNVEFKGDIAQF